VRAAKWETRDKQGTHRREKRGNKWTMNMKHVKGGLAREPLLLFAIQSQKFPCVLVYLASPSLATDCVYLSVSTMTMTMPSFRL